MRSQSYRVGGDEVTVHFAEHADDLRGFERFLSRTVGQILGWDTENSDLRIYGRGFRNRVHQFGTTNEAWVVPVEHRPGHQAAVRAALRDPLRRFVAHNAPYDLLVCDRTGLVPLEELGPRVYDTYILAHLCDPRRVHEGGTGLKLKEVCAVYVDPDAADTQKGLYETFRREYKATKDTGWAVVDVDHPLYVLYAGLDAIYAARLLRELGTLVRGNGLSRLAHFEHRVQLLTTAQTRRGWRVDTVYTPRLVEDLAAEAERHRTVAGHYGVDNINSTAQVIAALRGMGEQWPDKTDTGNPSVSKEVLLPMADLGHQWERLDVRAPNPVAEAVVRAKRASKWGGTYAQAFLDRRDDHDRIHPSIRSLAARTARMSVSDPPLQQLPSGDWTIRRALIADPGQVIIAADYSQVEMRVLAALSGDPALIGAIASGEDLHTFTARLVSGHRWEAMSDSERKRARKLYKAVGFGKVYGGGAATLARQTGAPLAQVKDAVAAYDVTFPGIKSYGRRLQREAGYGAHEVITPIGRHLPLDRDRAYAATNYVVQSTARDLLAKALVDIDDAGLSEHVLLPVHDELVCQAPAEHADEVIREIGRLMESTFHGVHIAADPEVYGPSWGHGYGAQADPVAPTEPAGTAAA